MKTKSSIPDYSKIHAAISASKGRFFYCEFIKRTTGELRKMTCRTGVRKFLKGGEKVYDAKSHNLITVYESGHEKEVGGGYRSISVENIKKIKIDGTTYEF